MRSLHDRLDPIKSEVLECLEKYGWGECYARGYFRDYIAAQRWVEETTGNPNFGSNPRLPVGNVQSLLDRTLDTFIRKLADLKTENARLMARNKYLEAQLSVRERDQVERLFALQKACEEV